MARGNLIQGYGRGKLGSTVYSISHGVQVSRVYNPAKFDRKSDSQIIRRAQWVSASQYYSRAVASQFKFAFEDKKPNESFQNAFMKRNWNRGIVKSFNDVNNPNYPSVGRFIVSQGSLRQLECLWKTGQGFYYEIPIINDSSIDINTLGYVSRALVSLGYRNGDIITFSVIRTDAQAGSNSQPILAGQSQPNYGYSQYRLDVDSTIALSQIGMTLLQPNQIGHTGFYGVKATALIDSGTINAASVQVSRQLKSKLLVSYAELTLNTTGLNAIMYGQSAEWRQVVIDSWKSSGTAILQGSESQNAMDDSVVTILNDLQFPRTWDSLNTKAVVTNKILTPTQFAERIIFYTPEGEPYRPLVYENGTIKYVKVGSSDVLATLGRDSSDQRRWAISSSGSSLIVQAVQAKNI